ncbi:LOW QUALITY PROTEIN: protein windpipe [Apis florea]|uniref:LOW QUALITY PROTEIN: protein windpipe n=1 Tax=Apis florea TaxID=7463 RepID=UPI0006299C9C|nr:LOW QUALITY PROTEIN: protein windpipe [Apis florea]
MLTTVLLSLLFILSDHAESFERLCVVKNETSARCQTFKDFRYIEIELENSMKEHVSEPNLHPSDVVTGLRDLDLSNGSLERIKTSTFRRFSNLTSLNLAENRIRDIETGSMDGLDRLHSLNLRGNRLQHLPPELGRLKFLKHLDLQGNPLRCDCATLATRDLLVNSGVKLGGNITCASPAMSKGIPLQKLDAAIVCRFEEQDLLGMQNDQGDENHDGSGDSSDKRDNDDDDDDDEEEQEQEQEEEEEKEEEGEDSMEIIRIVDSTTIRAESETPFREIDEPPPPVSTPFFEEVESPSQAETSTRAGEVKEEEEEQPSSKTFANEKIHEDGLFYPTEGSGSLDEEEEEEEVEGSGMEGSGTGGLVSTHPSRKKEEGFSLFDGLYNILWGTTEESTSSTNEAGPDLEEEQFIDVTKGEKGLEEEEGEEEEEEDKTSTSSSIAATITTTEIILVPGVNESSKLGNMKIANEDGEGNGDELASPTRQSKKGMGSYVVLAALLAILATLIGFAAYKGGFCRRRRKRGDVENGTELKDMQKALLETANAGAQAKVASNGNVESAPLVVDPETDRDEIKVSNDRRITAEIPKRSAVTESEVRPRSPSRGRRSRRDSIDGDASREDAVEDCVLQQQRQQQQQQPPLSPGAQRVKITVQENPDSVPKTPILITRTSNGENLVKTP